MHTFSRGSICVISASDSDNDSGESRGEYSKRWIVSISRCESKDDLVMKCREGQGEEKRREWEVCVYFVEVGFVVVICICCLCLRLWSYGVMVSTLDFESSDPGSNPGRTSLCCVPRPHATF